MAGLLADPEQVGIHDENWIAAQQPKAFDEAAAIVHQRVPLVGDQDFKAAITAQMRFHLVGMMMDVHDSPFDPGFRQRIQRIIDHGLAGDLYQRLWDGVGDWSHAGSEARGQYHGLFDGHLVSNL